MRQVVSVSLKEETVNALREKIKSSDAFRNKSHFIEFAIKKALRDLQNA